MPRTPTIEVEGAVTGTFHDGRNMIVLKAGTQTRVSEYSLPYLRQRKLINEDHNAQLDHDGDGKAGGSEAAEPPSLTGRNKAALFAIAADEGVTVPEDATNKEIAAAIQAKRDAGPEPELQPVEGDAASVLVSVEDSEFVVNAPWLDAPEPFATEAEAEERQAELREAGPPEGWTPEPFAGDEEQAPA